MICSEMRALLRNRSIAFDGCKGHFRFEGRRSGGSNTKPSPTAWRKRAIDR
jgi:hypothetical protein